MAISPPSDIVLDVARAVEPAGLQAARNALASRTSTVAPTGPDAAFTLDTGKSGPALAAPREAAPTSEADAFKKFESVVLQTFVQAMLPKDAEQVYGKGLAGDMWKSMMAGRIADVMSERGGIGIASRLLADRYVDGEVANPVGPISRGPERPDLDLQTALSEALVQEIQRKATNAFDAPRAAVSGASL